MSRVAIRRALISVYDKTGLAELAAALHAGGVQIVSTGTTAATISAAGVPVTPVEQITAFPECLDGRVKTLHPAVHAGLLADLSKDTHRDQLAELGIEPFDLLVSNLYPFEQTVASGAASAECVEQIDIGGPAMIRAAAKNHNTVAVITDPAAYPDVIIAVRDGGFTLPQRRRLAARAYARTAAYDVAVASWFASDYAPDEVAEQDGWPDIAAGVWTRKEALRYGENPHQRAALYLRSGAGSAATTVGIANAEQVYGKAMSYNNYVDADAARRAAFGFADPCVAIMKHANPCGIATGSDLADAYVKANACDPVSAYGGVIATNGIVTAAMAEQAVDVFTEVIVAPDFEPAALDIFTGRWKNMRLLRCPPPPPAGPSSGGRSAAACCSRPPTRPPSPAIWRPTGTSRPASRRTRRRSRTSSSRGARAARSSPTRSCSRPGAPASASAWARSTASTRAGWRWPEPATGRRAQSPPATPTSRSPTARRS